MKTNKIIKATKQELAGTLEAQEIKINEQHDLILDFKTVNANLLKQIGELENELTNRIEDNKLIEQENKNLLAGQTKLINSILQQGNTMNKLSSLIK